MVVLPKMAMLDLARCIGGHLHSLVDEEGKRVQIQSASADRLRVAAIVAMQIAFGDAVWPSDKKITIPAPTRATSIFEEAPR